MSTTSVCGCDLVDGSGRSAVNAAKAIAFETNLIQERGYEVLKEVDRILDPLVPVKPGNGNEGETPRDYIEYRFGITDTNVAATEDPFATGTVQTDVTINTARGPQNLTVAQKAGGSLACDNRSVTLAAGQDVRRGTYKMLPDVKSPCICIWDYARTSQLVDYLMALRAAMPVEMATLKERQLLRDLVALSKYNVAESGALEPIFTEGYFAHAPTAGPQISTFRKIRDRHKRQGHMGNIIVPISGPSLQNMMVSYYQTMGLVYQASNWTSGAFPSEWANEGRFTFEDITFVAKSTPILGYNHQISTAEFAFEPISTRRWRAGTGAGVVYDYDEDYDKPTITLNGQTYDSIEIIPIVSPQAFYQSPMVAPALNIENVNTDAMMWNGTTIRTIGGADIDCNEDRNKFFWKLKHAFKLVPRKPFLSSFYVVRKSDYIRGNNQLGLSFDTAAAAAQTYGIGAGRNANADSCADQRQGLYYPFEPAPNALSDICDPITNSAGEFRTNCAGTVQQDATSVVLTVERINGSSGAASIAWAANDGTGVAATDYTDGSGTLSWADGEYGVKYITIAIPETARHGKTFTVTYSSVTGASLVDDGCETTTLTITRPDYDYALAAGLTGTMNSMVVDGGSLSLPNFAYAATAAGAALLQDDLNDYLAANGGGNSNVAYSSGWIISVTGSHRVFTSATSASGTASYTQS